MMHARLLKLTLRVAVITMILSGLLLIPKQVQAQLGIQPQMVSTDRQEGDQSPLCISPNAPNCGSSSATGNISGRPADDPSLWLRNSSYKSSAATQPVDLSIGLSDNPDPVAPGGQLTYDAVVQNHSTSQSALYLTIVNMLPSDVTFVSASASRATCIYSNGVLTCSLIELGAGKSENITIVVTVSSSASGILVDSGSVTSANTDTDPANNSDTELTTVLGGTPELPDVAISMADAPDPVAQGADLTYINTVANIGGADATGVTLMDTLPPEVIFASATTTQGSCQESSGLVTCSLGNLAAGASARVDILVSVGPAVSGAIVNTADVDLNENDSNPANNSDSEGTLVVSPKASADLEIAMVDAPDPVSPGASLQYVNVISNIGGLAATGVVMTDTLPAGVTFVSAIPGQGTCSESSGIVKCSLGSLAEGASTQVTINLTVNPSTTGILINWASVLGNEVEVNLQNNFDNEGTLALATADMAIQILSTPNPVIHEKNLTYTLDIQNNGPSPATGVVMTDTLPAGASFVSAIPSQGTCTNNAGVVTCSIGSLAVGGTANVQIILVPAGPTGTVSSLAAVKANEFDPCPINNQDIEDTTIMDLLFLPLVNLLNCQSPFCGR